MKNTLDPALIAELKIDILIVPVVIGTSEREQWNKTYAHLLKSHRRIYNEKLIEPLAYVNCIVGLIVIRHGWNHHYHCMGDYVQTAPTTRVTLFWSNFR